MMKRTTLMMMTLLLAIVMALVVPVLTDAVTQTTIPYTGTFNGTNSPTVTIGGNCPPVNARLDVSGKCEGTNSVSGSCSSVPNADTDYGIFQSAYASASCGACSYSPGCSCGVGVTFSTGESCSGGCYCSGGMGGCGGFYFWWNSCSTSCGVTTSKPANQGTAVSGCGGGTSVKYIPCTKNPQAVVNLTAWKYGGLVKNTTTISIPIGTNSNPSSSPSGYVGAKVPIGNIVLGNNLISMSALELNKFGYTLYWTEETASGGGDADGDGYYSGQCTLGNDCDDGDPAVNPGHLEVPGNGKDDNCDGVVDTLYINSMADITAYCPYTSTTRTYSCTGGWENVYVQNDISLGQSSDCPWKKCGPCKSRTICGGASPRNIVFTANNEFSAKQFYANNPCGDGGSITIKAKKITATSLNTYGSECHRGSCTCSGPYCSSNNGGPITLKADTITVGSLNANDGRGRYSGGGVITVVANTTTINSISSAGASYYCSGDYDSCDGAGSGGTIKVNAKKASIGSVSLQGGASTYPPSGGSGGSLYLEVEQLTLGPVNLNGNRQSCSAGTVRILSSNASILGSIEAKGYMFDGSPGRYWSHDYYGGNGQVKIGADYLKGTAPFTTSGQGTGGSVKLYLDAYNISSVSSSSLAFVSDNPPQDRAFISAGSLRLYPRSKTAIFGFNTSILPDVSAKSFQIRLKEMNGTYVRSYGYEWSETGTITPAGKVSHVVGQTLPLAGFVSGRKYILELTTSTDAEFDDARCKSGAATCSSYDIGFVEWS